MCNCPLTSLNKVLISVFSRSLWLKWSFNYWRTAREGKGADGEEVEQWTLKKKKKNLWTWESCHNVDLNLGALQSFSNLVMCVHIDKLWNRLPQTLEKRYFFSMMISELPATVLGWMLVLSHKALSWALGDLPCVCSLWVKSSSFRYSCMTCDFHYIWTKLQVRPKVID